jgi:ABC-type glycerol-3-phosphate transport system substrate-binding protein
LAVGGLIGSQLAPSPSAPSGTVATTTVTSVTTAAASTGMPFAPTPELGPVTATIATGRPDAGGLAVNIPEFSSQTGVKVNLEDAPWGDQQVKVALDLTSGTGRYDVVWLPTRYAVDYNQYFMDLKPWYDAMPDDYKNDYMPGIVELNTFGGRLIGLPFKLWGVCMFYRKDVLEKLGQSLPKTMDDFVEVLKMTTIPGQMWGTAYTTSDFLAPLDFVQFCNAFMDPKSGQTFAWYDNDGHPTADAEWNVEGLQWMLDRFVKDKSVPPNTLELKGYDAQTLFESGKLAFFPSSGVAYTEFTDPSVSTVVDLWGVGQCPFGPNHVQMGYTGGQGLGIPEASKHKEAAWGLIKYVCGMEGTKNQARYSTLEVSRKSAYDIPEIPKYVADAMKAGFLGDPANGIPPQVPYQPQFVKKQTNFYDILVVAMQDALSQKKTPKQALTDAQAAAVAAGVGP